MHDPNPNKVFADNSCAQAWKLPFMASGHVLKLMSGAIYIYIYIYIYILHNYLTRSQRGTE